MPIATALPIEAAQRLKTFVAVMSTRALLARSSIAAWAVAWAVARAVARAMVWAVTAVASLWVYSLARRLAPLHDACRKAAKGPMVVERVAVVLPMTTAAGLAVWAVAPSAAATAGLAVATAGQDVTMAT
eukprot:481917-Pleurochrysis_carterae.AAC.1